ncbi:MAG: methyltransferase domain-containing protein [Gammaproteobacteria bacterium]|nr:methyltransferase domain-containing protein [Gammaproteobacteria bacterium]
MPLDKIKDTLKDAIGLDIGSIGTSALVGAIQRRMRTNNNLESYEDYLSYLLTNELEIKSLIEEIVVTETWFFRDDKPFPVLSRHIKKLMMSGSFNPPLRIFSMPSSTGEEPYSIAITLLECGLTENQFSIDAIDVSTRALAIARTGIYGENSFRGKQDINIIEKYFSKYGDEYIISDLVRSMVNFHHGNILKMDINLFADKYDVVFCRNMLIYFDNHNKAKTYDIIEQLLKDKGILFVGHAETSSVPERIFTSSEYRKSFSFIKEPYLHAVKTEPLKFNPKEPTPSKAIKIRKSPNKIIPTKKSPGIHHKGHKKSTAVTVNNKPESNIITGDVLDNARKLADTGKLNEAKEICIRHLKNNKNDAQGYFLLGLIAIASEEIGIAEQYLRKSIYLDPKRHEALIHLSLLLEQSGDLTGADRMRKRAHKAEIAGNN